jgi:hypothetical protein
MNRIVILMAALAVAPTLAAADGLDRPVRTARRFSIGFAAEVVVVLKHIVSPYLYLRTGMLLYHKLQANLGSGAGVEVSAPFGLNVLVDGGADCFLSRQTDSFCAPRVGLGIGYRF